MGRSVSTPCDATAIAYAHFDEIEEFDWEVIEPFVDNIRCRYPSAYAVDAWAGREDRVVARNSFAEFGVSEYCGLVAYWVRPRPDATHEGLAEVYCNRIASGFEKHFGALRKIGHASNGEAFFERIAA